MKGDFSRLSFRPTSGFSRILMQQGRVLLDADVNEQIAIERHYLRSLAMDLIGPHGGPRDGAGFEIERCDEPHDFWIKPGRYYVQGVLCENFAKLRYSQQPYFDSRPSDWSKKALVYLDVRERVIFPAEDASIQEVALGEADTALRLQSDWRVKVIKWDPSWRRWFDFDTFMRDVCKKGEGDPPLLTARAQGPEPENEGDTAAATPRQGYRGLENQLYRVEIHRPGGGGTTGSEPPATFKWSRENGSVVFRIKQVEAATVYLENARFLDRLGLNRGDTVEILDQGSIRECRPDPLLRIVDISDEHTDEPWVQLDKEPRLLAEPVLLRRWDQDAATTPDDAPEGGDGALVVREGEWLDLEDGVQVQFGGDKEGAYRAGDYWLLPARTLAGLEWPHSEGHPQPVPASRELHCCAPLAIIYLHRDGTVRRWGVFDQRMTFKPLTSGWLGEE